MAVLVSGSGGGGKPYTGDNPLTIGADGYNFPAKTLLKDGLKILNGVKSEGEFVWKKLTAEGGDFIDYVVSSDADAYPDGGKFDGHWYEIPKEGAKYGIFFNEVNQYFNPLDCEMIFGENVPANQFYNYTAASSWWGACKKLKITAKNVLSRAFYTHFGYFCGKLKIDAIGLMNGNTFTGIGKSANSAPKIWISKRCATIYCDYYYEAPFYDCKSGTKLYCEAESKPSNWAYYWNYDASNTPMTVVWGVTEEEFDAL